MKIKHFIIMLVVGSFMGMSGFNQVQAQVVEFPDKGVSVQIPDRFQNSFDMSTHKTYKCAKANDAEDDSKIEMDISNSKDSVDKLLENEAKFLFSSAEIIDKRSFVGAHGKQQAYLLSKLKWFGKENLTGFVFVDLGQNDKMKIKVAVPFSESNKKDFNDILDSICTRAVQNETKENVKVHHKEFHIGFHIGIPW